jgi:hypothetical protein
MRTLRGALVFDLLLGLFRLVVGLVPFKRPLRSGLESKREFGTEGQELADLLLFTSASGHGEVCRMG